MKYAIVTGASPSSIGFLAAKKLALKPYNFRVILACRNEQKGKQAEHLINSELSSSQQNNEDSAVSTNALYLPLDLASFESVHQFVNQVHELDNGNIGDGGLHLLINNAGIGWGKDTPYIQTTDGLEEIVGVNHFGTFLLTQLLLDDLKQATTQAEGQDEARIVIVSSSLHDGNSWKRKSNKTKNEDDDATDNNLILPNFPDGILQTKDNYDGFKAYQTSKLCNLWLTYELQRRLNADEQTESPIKVNAVSPGFIPTTGLTRRSGWLGTFFLNYVLDPWRYLGLGITRSPEDGAEVIVQAATSTKAGRGGQYFHLPKGENEIEAIPSSEESIDEEKAKVVWDMSMKICHL